jgi:hypothetical protein
MTDMKYHLSRAGNRAAAVTAGTAVAALAVTGAAFGATSPGASPGQGAARTASAAIPRCTAASGQDGNVSAWVAGDQGNGALGTIYYPLEFTNLSAHACSMDGFPGVSALSTSGEQLGSPADWESGGAFGMPGTVIVAPGATVHAMLAYHDAQVGSPGCDPVSTTGWLRVYPPGQRGAAFAFFGLQACSNAGPAYLSVGPVKPGVGTING